MSNLFISIYNADETRVLTSRGTCLSWHPHNVLLSDAIPLPSYLTQTFNMNISRLLIFSMTSEYDELWLKKCISLIETLQWNSVICQRYQVTLAQAHLVWAKKCLQSVNTGTVSEVFEMTILRCSDIHPDSDPPPQRLLGSILGHYICQCVTLSVFVCSEHVYK